ncbi:MAG: hypothetical protein P1U89_23120 [Verrucomicrobiales bacterium]|nr:hypothetical protein [Verrucomicrobiales bacterium]
MSADNSHYAMKAESTFSLKDELFNAEKVDALAISISRVYPDFETSRFCKTVVKAFPDLELKERIVHITACLEDHLPKTFPKAVGILLKALPPELDPSKTDDDFGDFILAPVSHYVVRNGCSEKHLSRSLNALREITKRFSAEDAIRYFINAFPEESFAFLDECSRDGNYHVRRLASEGSRPRLPWSQKLVTGFEKPLPILEELHKDPTRYVTRSVANHLNDISKLDSATVITLLKRWKKQKRQSENELAFITRHSLRTLVKESNRDALKLLGFDPSPDLTIESLSAVVEEIAIGESFEFLLRLVANKAQKLLIDYVMEGPSGRAKVYKIKQLSVGKGEVVELQKRHPMRLMTSRTLETGTHKITLQINGKRFDAIEFVLS